MLPPDFYRHVVAEVPGAAIFVVDRNYRFVSAGGDGLVNTGMSPSDFVGRGALDVVPPELKLQIQGDYDAAFAGRSFSREHSVGDRYFITHGKPLHSPDGKFVEHALVVSYDITERKMAESRLSVLEAASTVARNSVNEQQVIQDIARLLRKKLGVSGVFFGDAASFAAADGSITGFSCDGDDGVVETTLLCPHVLSAIRTGNTIACNDATARLRYSHFMQVNEIVFAVAILCPYVDASGTKSICVVLSQNGERRWRSDELALLQELCTTGWQSIEKHRHVDELRAASVKQNRFLAVLGHELRNPLSAIKSALDLIALSKLPAHHDRAKTVFEQQFSQINRLMEDLTAIAQANSPEASHLRTELVEVSALVDNTVRAIRHAADGKSQTITKQLLGPVYLLIDEVRITQVVNNLLSNAIKYTPVGGTIDVSLCEASSYVELRVKDNGIGMSEETREAIFDMYGRGREALALAQDGLGVGMWLAKRFVEAHDGQIHAMSEGEGKGSTFVMRLPRKATN